MMRAARLAALAVLLGWAAAITAQPAPPPAAAAPAVVTPKIVVQALSAGGFDVAAWSADSRFVFTASGERRELLVWDMMRGIIIDRLRLPSDGKSSQEYMRLHRMTLQPDKRTLRIEGDVLGGTAITAPRVYLVDTSSRRITITRPGPAKSSNMVGDLLYGLVRLADGMGTAEGIDLRERMGGNSKAARPALPRSPDGRWGLVRAGDGLALVGADGKRRDMPAKPMLAGIAEADLSPDDRRLVIMTMAGNRLTDTAKTTSIDVIDITTGDVLPHADLPGRYDRVRWLDDDHYAALPRDLYDDGPTSAPTLKVLIVNAVSGAIVRPVEARCHMVVVRGPGMATGTLVGASLANCLQKAPARQELERLVDGVWVAMPGAVVPKGAVVSQLAASPRGDRLALALDLADGSVRLRIHDAVTGAPGATLTLPAASTAEEPLVSALAFSPDGRRLWLAGSLDGGEDGLAVHEWQPDAPVGPGGKPVLRSFAVQTFMSTRFASRDNRLLIGGGSFERIRQIDLTTGALLPDINFAGAAALGYMRTRPIMWAAGTNDGVRLWDQRSGQVLMTISLLPKQRQVVVGGDGRYDTNMGPESENFRWLMSDRPFQSLAPQTLMRDYYEPQLIRKLMDCAAANNCMRVLKPLPSLAGLNRQLPEVRITGVTATDPGWAQVRVAATDTTDPVDGRKSGVFGVKLLMNNREVARDPDLISPPPQRVLADWRKVNASPPGAVPGVHDWTFKVMLPSDGKPLEFAAYSFNSDRVKSDTVRLAWTPPPSARRPRRAFVLTIGVNDYTESRLNLNYAVPDAQLIADRLVRIPGYDTRRASLTTALLPDGRMRQVTSDDIIMALTILAGFKGEGMRDMLREAGHDVAALDEATPDDIVIISFSGHGYADAVGSFALLASDVRWDALDAAPDPGTTINADTLTNMLRYIQAGEIAFIIDACHSGAAVNTPDFKPGPMGDPGLGQLAFDKGIRILAATQADDVALENARLAQGFLTAALGEGLTATGGPADSNRDGKVLLDEWLRYAVARLPSLEEEVRRGGGPMAARGVRLVMRTQGAAAPKSQEPSLFDFNPASSPVILRGQP
jgi:hypothetical protein